MAILKLKQPKGFYVISLGELCERFSYYGAQTLLVLYLTAKFSLSDNESYSIYGAYAAFTYALPVFGGLLADRLLTLKESLIIGGFLLICGNILMFMPHLNTFYTGLSLTACGIGLYKPNSSAMVGALYHNNDPRRESGFTLFYISMNIGAAISPFVYGLISKWGYHYAYLFSASILLVNWLTFLMYKQHIFLNNPLPVNALKIYKIRQKCLAYSLIILTCMLVNILFIKPVILNNFFLFSALIILSTLILYAAKRQPIERNRMFALLILGFFGMCFFAASLQVGSSINLFIQTNINRTIGNYQIPAVMFTSLYPLAVIFAAPFIVLIWSYLSALKKEPSIPAKFFCGLLLVSAGFIFFALASVSAKNITSHWPVFWIVIGNLALGMGEICLMPAMFSAIARFSPHNLKSTMMGVWYLFIAFGGYLSGFAAKLSHKTMMVDTAHILSNITYQYAFLKISMLSFMAAFVLWIFIPFINKLISSDNQAAR